MSTCWNKGVHVQPHRRSAAAFIAAALSGHDSSRSILDLKSNQLYEFEGHFSTERLLIIAFPRGTLYSGSDAGGSLSIYDHDTQAFFTLEIRDERFGGFDYEFGAYFSGTIDGTM